MSASPLTVARAHARAGQQAQQDAASNAARYMAARRRDAARNGYRGPLTRAELAQQTASQDGQS